MRLRCLCFSWGCQLPPHTLASTPHTHTRTRKRSARITARPDTSNSTNRCWRDPLPTGWWGLQGGEWGLQVRFQGFNGLAPPISSKLLPLEAMGCQTPERPEVRREVRQKARKRLDTKCQMTPSSTGGWGAKKKEPSGSHVKLKKKSLTLDEGKKRNG